MNESSRHPAKIVIAHRGASGYLPEHTLPAKALAYAMGADFLEQDIVLSRDDVPLVLHDIYLDTVTDVATRFPDRHRDDGRYYAIDFELSELKTLRVTERFDPKTGLRVHPQRFPAGKSEFRIATLTDEIELVQGLNESTKREVGIYPEIKKPAWHRSQGKDISRIVVETLMEHGYNDKSDNVCLQCFDATETERIRDELDCHLTIIQLVAKHGSQESDTDYDGLCTAAGLDRVARYADGIGPAIERVVDASSNRAGFAVSDLVELAHQRDLVVHAYTLRADALPGYVDAFERLVEIVLFEADTDGVFSDFPDRTVKVRDQLLAPIDEND